MGKMKQLKEHLSLRSINQQMAGTYSDDSGRLWCQECNTPRTAYIPSMGAQMPIICKCMADRFAKEERERKKREEDALKKRKIAAAFVHENMRKLNFEGDDGRSGEAMEKAKAYARRFVESRGSIDYGLLFFGKPDGGKTFLSCCIANEALNHGFSVIVRSMTQIMENREDVSRLLSCDLLIVDDLGAERSTSYGQECVYSVIDGRYCQKKPVIVSTNLTRSELAAPADIMSARIYGRILESCLPVEVDTGRRRATKERYEQIKKDMGI